MKKLFIYLIAVLLLASCFSRKLYNYDAELYGEEGKIPPVKQVLLISRTGPNFSERWKKLKKAMQEQMTAKGIGIHFIGYKELDEAVMRQIADTVAACKIEFILRLQTDSYDDRVRAHNIGFGIAPGNNSFMYSESNFSFMGYVTEKMPYRLALKCACSNISRQKQQTAAACLINAMTEKKLIQ